MKNPLLSVVIPTLNEERFLPNLLSDLSRQKEKNFEVIVVDGNSDDNTVKKARSYKDKLPIRTYIVSKRNVSYQRNFGAEKAKGKYLVFIDADSRINSTYLSKIKKNIESSKYLIYIPEIIPQNQSISDKLFFKIINVLIALSQYTKKPFSSGGFMIVEKGFFSFLGGFNEKCYLSEDHDLVQRAKKSGVTAKTLNGARIKFSIRRFKKEGRFDVFVKYIIGMLYTLRSGGIEKPIFDYQMGGGHYTRARKKKISVFEFIQKYSLQLRDYLRILKDINNNH